MTATTGSQQEMQFLSTFLGKCTLVALKCYRARPAILRSPRCEEAKLHREATLQFAILASGSLGHGTGCENQEAFR